MAGTSPPRRLAANAILQRLPAQQFRDFAYEACRLANEQPFKRRQAIDQAEPDIANKTQDVRAVGEQPVEAIGGNTHRHRIEAPPALIALEHIERARIESKPRRIDNDFGERGDVL